MPIDLSNASILTPDASSVATQGGIDLSNASIVNTDGSNQTSYDRFKMVESKPNERQTAVFATEYPDEGFLNGIVHSAEGAAWNLIAKPILGMKDPDVDKLLSDTEKQHPIAAVIGGSVPYIATMPLVPESLLPAMWMRFGAQAGAIGGLNAFGNARVEEGTKTIPQKAADIAVATGESAALGAVMGGAQSISILKRPFASILARAGATFSGTTVLSTFFGQNITEAMKQGGVLTAVGLMAETPSLAKTAMGRGIITRVNDWMKTKEAIPAVDVTEPEIAAKVAARNLEEAKWMAQYEKESGQKLPKTIDVDSANENLLKFQLTVAAEKMGRDVGLDKPQVLSATVKLPDGREFDGASHEDALNKVGEGKDTMVENKDYSAGFRIMDSDGTTKIIDRAEAKTMFGKDQSHEFEGLNSTKFLTPPEEPKIVNPEILEKQKEREKLGETGQMDIAMIPGANEVAENVTKAHEELQKTFAPFGIEGGKFTAATMRENLGKFARSQDMFENATHKAKKMFDKANRQSSLDFIYKMEAGETQQTKELSDIAGVLRERLDAKRNEIQALGTGKLETFIENYFPHIWDKPGKAQSLIKSFFSRKPWEGGKSFLKKRTIETTKAGIEAGLTPVTYNPVDLAMLKLREMDKYLAAHKTIGAMKKQGLMEFVPEEGAAKASGKQKAIPSGWKKIDDKISQVRSRLPTGELVIRGDWYAQPDAARIVNNYLSPGLRGNYMYDMYRGAGNTMNQFQLGLSAFHLGFTSMDATISSFALGLNKISRGDISGAKNIGKALFPLWTPIETVMQGHQLLKAWDGQDVSPLHNALAEVMATAGGRARMDKFYATNGFDSMMKAFKEQKYISGIFKAPQSVLEWAAKPIMEHLVPRQKLGVFADMVKFEMERNPNMTHEQLRDVAQKAWDSVDNRMGQMVYDNLFWNKTVKDIGMASVRSLGWNLGTVREIGGGIKDIKGLATGKGLSYRTAYVLALPAVTALYGAMYQYLATGEGPQEIRDYFFPKTGGIDKKGMPARVSLPTYMKDIYHYTKNPVGTISNKFSPVNSMIIQMLQNKDFYGTKIRNEDDGVIQQALDELGYVGGQFMPFGIRNLQRDTRTGSEAKVEPFIGIVPAPYDVSFTAAEMRAHELAMAKSQGVTRTKEQAEKSKTIADVRNQYFQSGDEAVLDQAIDDEKITQKNKNEIIKEKDMTNLERLTRHLTYEEVMSVYKKASDKEKEELQNILNKKRSNAERAGAWTDKREELYQAMFEGTTNE